jgi:hypothetical protein
MRCVENEAYSPPRLVYTYVTTGRITYLIFSGLKCMFELTPDVQIASLLSILELASSGSLAPLNARYTA